MRSARVKVHNINITFINSLSQEMVSTNRLDGSKGENHAAIGGNRKGRSVICGRMWGIKRATRKAELLEWTACE